jgi:adenine-specific DNA-methyltransferase
MTRRAGGALPSLTYPRLVVDAALSCRAEHPARAPSHDENVLVHGDNLPALKALLPRFGGEVQCIYIDPPYNTGASFEHYDDDAEHAAWLGALRARVELLRGFLREDGVMFVSIHDANLASLTLMMHEVFGRRNFCGYLIWEKKKKPSFLDARLGSVTEFILVYAKDRRRAPPLTIGVTTPNKKYPLNNAGNGLRVLRFPPGSVQFHCPDQSFEAGDMSQGNIHTRLLDRVVVRGGTNVGAFRVEGEWRYAQAKLDEVLRSGEAITIRKAPFRPNHVRAGGAPKKMKNLLSIAHYGMSTYEDAARESAALFGEAAFDYPKPERLLATLIGAVTQPGDLVLDAYLGSGTTAAVAHKLGRRWIGVERGEQAVTHVVPRLRRVIQGQDPGGVTQASGWTGGGGFEFYRVIPSRP